MPPKGRWRSHKGQKNGCCTLQPGSGAYVGAVYIVEALESQGRTQQDLGFLLFLLHLILLKKQRQPAP